MPAKIGITMSEEAAFGAHLRRAYYERIVAAGGLPLALPPLPAALAAPLLQQLDGLLLAGGGDLAAAYFGQPPLPPLGESEPARDALELELARLAWQEGVPILAICRGMQVLNVALGGGIWQDLSYLPGPLLQHSQSQPAEQTSHRIRVADARLARLLGTEMLSVNSHHHQAVRGPAPLLQAAAYAPDGVIEALLPRAAEGRFCLGLQWHPERLDDAPGARIFAAFCAAAQEYAEKRPNE